MYRSLCAPVKLSLWSPYLLDSGAGTESAWRNIRAHTQNINNRRRYRWKPIDKSEEAGGETNRHTDTLNAILRPTTDGEVINGYVYTSKNSRQKVHLLRLAEIFQPPWIDRPLLTDLLSTTALATGSGVSTKGAWGHAPKNKGLPSDCPHFATLGL